MVTSDADLQITMLTLYIGLLGLYHVFQYLRLVKFETLLSESLYDHKK